MKIDKNKIVFFIAYFFIVGVILTFFATFGHIDLIKNFIIKTEANLFDLRQNIVTSKNIFNNNHKDNPFNFAKTPSSEIIILDIDNESYEYVMDKYGTWPISRRLWGEVINNLTSYGVKYLIFDMLFIKPDKTDVAGDNYFVQAVKNHNNVYLSMNFDNYPEEVRVSPVLNDNLSVKINKGELKDNDYITFTNARAVMQKLSDVTDSIGSINVTRDEDGVIRNVTPLFKYKNSYYPNLSLRVALDMFNKNDLDIVNNTIILDENHHIPLDETNRAIINWYGPSHTYKHVSFWQTVDAIRKNDSEFLKSNFSGKIVYVGTSATALSDVKSVPLDKNIAGVEIHTNFLNNVMDNSFIKRTSFKLDIIISLAFSLVLGYCVLNMHSVIKSFIFLFLFLITYTLASCILMASCNLWISLIVPYTSYFITFIVVYCQKYIMRTKDYEQTYKLAVTDGLTQLYNHRFFQEKMIQYSDMYKKSEKVFSLILIDIDFFKKFNDTYGHQSGDIVLIQVANILKKNSRTDDIVARYGGEEMTLILPMCNKNDAIRLAEKICKAVRETTFTLAHGEKVNVTISLGVATSGIDGVEPQEIISYSDKCLYKAKEQGRNQVVSET